MSNTPIRDPKVDVTRGPSGLYFAVCRHCEYRYGPSVKTHVHEMAIAHRKDHRTGRADVTK